MYLTKVKNITSHGYNIGNWFCRITYHKNGISMDRTRHAIRNGSVPRRVILIILLPHSLLKEDYTMEKFNIDDIKYEDTTCPVCMKSRFWLKFYCNKTIQYCNDCGFWNEI